MLSTKMYYKHKVTNRLKEYYKKYCTNTNKKKAMLTTLTTK